MSVFNLPDDIFSKKELASGIIIHHYTATRNSLREKSVLHRNAFSLVITGSKTMHFAEKTVHVNDSEIHMLSAGNCIASVSINKQQPFESILVFFDNETLLEFYAEYGLPEKFKKYRTLRPEAYIEFKKDDFLRNYIQSLLVTLRKRQSLSESMKKIKLKELLLYLLENHTRLFLSFIQSKKLSDHELQIKTVVEVNKFNNLTLDELAFLCNISTATFKRHFKKIHGTTHSIWLNRQRMTIARKMLSEKREKPGEIWHKLGFETHTGFTKSFKKHFGSLPSHLRVK